MKIEHTAFPAADPVATANWYVANLALRIVRQTGAPTYTTFLSDSEGGIVEIYNNPRVAVPNYAAMDALLLHIAFEVEDMEGERQRLLDAGCTVDEDITSLPSGDVVTMLRDPWGFALQLVKRAAPMR
ncbi:VOC family protein [bacterium]|nr:MAG: VOC family protein [bacterium]